MNKKNIIILILLIIILILITSFFYIDFVTLKDIDVFFVNENQKEDVNNDSDDEFVNVGYLDNNDIYDKIEIEIDEDVIKDNVDNCYYNCSEEDVVSYFESFDDEVEASVSFNVKFKEYFITIVDFIFYGTEIKGYTFDELTDVTKTKIISVALKMDCKIEEYIPDYKENISSTSNKIYTNVKEKLVIMYLDISVDICKNNREECDKVKNIFGEIKSVCKIGWDFIKGLIKDGVSKVKEWYEIYSGK